jgi:hypothetical protein
MKTPPQVIIYRLVTATITALILLAITSGVASRGPLRDLGARTSQADQLVHNLYAKGWLG